MDGVVLAVLVLVVTNQKKKASRKYKGKTMSEVSLQERQKRGVKKTYSVICREKRGEGEKMYLVRISYTVVTNSTTSSFGCLTGA